MPHPLKRQTQKISVFDHLKGLVPKWLITLRGLGKQNKDKNVS